MSSAGGKELKVTPAYKAAPYNVKDKTMDQSSVGAPATALETSIVVLSEQCSDDENQGNSPAVKIPRQLVSDIAKPQSAESTIDKSKTEIKGFDNIDSDDSESDFELIEEQEYNTIGKNGEIKIGSLDEKHLEIHQSVANDNGQQTALFKATTSASDGRLLQKQHQLEISVSSVGDSDKCTIGQSHDSEKQRHEWGDMHIKERHNEIETSNNELSVSPNIKYLREDAVSSIVVSDGTNNKLTDTPLISKQDKDETDKRKVDSKNEEVPVIDTPRKHNTAQENTQETSFEVTNGENIGTRMRKDSFEGNTDSNDEPLPFPNENQAKHDEQTESNCSNDASKDRSSLEFGQQVPPSCITNESTDATAQAITKQNKVNGDDKSDDLLNLIGTERIGTAKDMIDKKEYSSIDKTASSGSVTLDTAAVDYSAPCPSEITSQEKHEGHVNPYVDSAQDKCLSSNGDAINVTTVDNEMEKNKDTNETDQSSNVLKTPSHQRGASYKESTKKNCMAVKCEFGEVKLIKVGKFYIISVNGKKSKLPKTVNQDTTLRFHKREDDDVLLLTDTVCFKVQMSKGLLQLEDISRIYLEKPVGPMPQPDNKDSDDSDTNDTNLHQGTEDRSRNSIECKTTGIPDNDTSTNMHARNANVENYHQQTYPPDDQKDLVTSFEDGKPTKIHGDVADNLTREDKPFVAKSSVDKENHLTSNDGHAAPLDTNKTDQCDDVTTEQHHVEQHQIETAGLRNEMESVDVSKGATSHKVSQNKSMQDQSDETPSPQDHSPNESENGNSFQSEYEPNGYSASAQILKTCQKGTVTKETKESVVNPPFEEQPYISNTAITEVQSNEFDVAKQTNDQDNHEHPKVEVNTGYPIGEKELEENAAMKRPTREKDNTGRESPVLEQPETMCCGRPPEEVGTKPKVSEAVRFPPKIIEGRIVEGNELIQPSQDYELRQHDGDIQSMRNSKDTIGRESPALGPSKEVFHEEEYGDDITNPQEGPRYHKHEFDEGKKSQDTVKNEGRPIEHHVRIHYKVEDKASEETKSCKMTFSVDQYMRWMFFCNSRLLRSSFSKLTIEKTIMEISIDQEFCRFYTPFESQTQIPTVLRHLKDEVMRFTTNIDVKSITTEIDCLTGNMKSSTLARNKEIYIDILNGCTMVAYPHRLHDKVIQMTERYAPKEQGTFKTTDKEDITRRVKDKIGLPSDLPWKELFERFNLGNTLKQRFPTVQILIDTHPFGITVHLDGLIEEVSKTKQYLQNDFMNTIHRQKVDLPFTSCDKLDITDICSLLGERLDTSVLLRLESTMPVIYSLDQKSLRDSIAFIRTNFVYDQAVKLTANWRGEDAVAHLTEKYAHSSQERVLLFFNKQRTEVTIIGWKPRVMESIHQIKQLQDSPFVRPLNGEGKVTREEIKKTRLYYSLKNGHLWSSLFGKFNISERLKNKAVSDEFVIQTNLKKDDSGNLMFVLLIEGQEEVAGSIIDIFMRDFEKTLSKREVYLNYQLKDILVQTDVKTFLEGKFPNILVDYHSDTLTIYAFNKEDCQTAANKMDMMYTEDRVSLPGELRNKTAAQDIIDKFNGTEEGISVTLDKDGFSIKIAGIKDTVKRLTKEITDYVQQTSSITVAVENIEAFAVLQLESSFLGQLKRIYGAQITPIQQEDYQGMLIEGTSFGIRECEQEIQDYLSNIKSESLEVNELVNNVFTKEFQVTIDAIKAEHRVMTETSIQHSSGLVYFDGRQDKKEWRFPNGQKLVLLNQDTNPADTFYVVEMDESSTQRADSKYNVVGNRSVTTMTLPQYRGHDDTQTNRMKDIIKDILEKANSDKEEAIMFQLRSLKTWRFENIMKCWMTAFYDYFKNRKGILKFILLSVCKADFDECLHSFRTVMVDFSSAQSIPRAQQTRDFRITLSRGKLNETKADILVNTASANLDLTKGAVSYSLLQTAGNQLQTEISSRYKNGIKPSEVALTAGYKLQCKYVFHGALKSYDRNIHAQVVHEFRQFIRNCLVAAQTKGAKSIAFPAIGTGNLRYPLALVVDEMYQTVNKYKEETPNTTLVDVLFIVFDGDFHACEAFDKRQKIEKAKYNDTGRKAVQGSPVKQERQGYLKIKVTGHKTNTEKAMTVVGKLLYPSKHNKETDMKSMSYAGALQLPKQQPRTSTLTAEAREPSKKVMETAFRCDTEGITVLVYEGNILHLPVDCIVNPANNQLGHAAGLALAIANAAGYWLTQDSNELIRKRGRVATGDAVKTTAGNLKYKCVIHAVGPCWSDFSPHTVEDIMKCRDDLKSAIFTSLLIAESNSMTSVAIPAVSSAIFGVPKQICVMEYVKAVQEFSSSKPKHLKVVHFVDIDPHIIGLLIQGFTDMIIDRKPCPWNWKIFAKKESSAGAVGGANAHAHQKDSYQAIPNFIESRESLTCKFTQTRIVSVSREDIFSFKGVDVIVCSEDVSGTATGGVAKLLLKKGGWKYEHEKKHEFQITKPKTGDVFITSGGNTGYKWIIHAVMPHRSHYGQDERGWEKALRTMIDTIFDTVVKRRYRSMVMSLLGTGAGNSDPMQCAKILLDSLTISCTRYPDSDLFLHVVNNNAERNQIVSKLFKDHVLASKRYLQSGISQDTKRATSKNERTTPAREGKRPTENTKCAICLDNMVNPKTLKCGHAYCSSCIEKCFKVKPVCPTCGAVCGKLTGDQPDGDMTIEKTPLHLPGHDCDTIRITYDFGSGTQGGNHPTPGRRYQAVTRIAYLPYIDEGREVCALLKLAFERRLVFTIGVSRTTGEQGVITWNDIHHKTDTKRGAQFGYPDSTYFTRVKEELVVKGVTITDPDLEKNLKKKLDTIGKETIPVKTCRSSGSFETTV